MPSAPHILVVDDHREIRELVSRALTKEGFRVSTAAGGRAMRQALADAHIDLILLDLMLPGEDGLSLCRSLRTQSSIPIIMLTARGDEVDNAVKYGKAGTAAMRRGSRAIEIVIDDEGPGIPQEELTRVLEPFYRLDESRSRETGGVGLGLAIAQSIVETHGGSLALGNRPEGGLRVRLSLPV